jgi:hypothetical protein
MIAAMFWSVDWQEAKMLRQATLPLLHTQNHGERRCNDGCELSISALISLNERPPLSKMDHSTHSAVTEGAAELVTLVFLI